MLSSIHPLGEAGRGQRWWLTVTAHIAGSALGGALLAGALGVAGWLFARLGVGWTARLALVVAVAAVAVLADGRGWPGWLWRPRRQVNEDWLTTYRGWVYGGGFGLQLGLGLVTIVTAATLYVLAAVAFAVAALGPALVLGLVFGAVRGASVLAGRGIDRPDRLVRFHRRLQERARWGRVAAVTADATVLAGVVALLCTA
jgi:hypothetical protein